MSRSVRHKGTRAAVRESPISGFETLDRRSLLNHRPRRGRGGPSPSTTNITGPATSTSRAAASSWSAAWAACVAVTGTGRASGSHGWPGAAVPVKASSAVRPSRPVISTAAMSLVLSWARPASSTSTSPSSATTGHQQTDVLRARRATALRGRRVARRRVVRRERRGQLRVDRAGVAGEAGVGDGAHPPDRSRRVSPEYVGWSHAPAGDHRQHHLGRARPDADRHRRGAQLGRLATPRPRPPGSAASPGRWSPSPRG